MDTPPTLCDPTNDHRSDATMGSLQVIPLHPQISPLIPINPHDPHPHYPHIIPIDMSSHHIIIDHWFWFFFWSATSDVFSREKSSARLAERIRIAFWCLAASDIAWWGPLSDVCWFINPYYRYIYIYILYTCVYKRNIVIICYKL